MPFNNTHIWIGIESSFKLLRIDLTLLINDMSIDLGDHRGLCVTGITLSGFNITMIDFKLVSCAGVPLRYNKDKRKNPVFSRVSAFVVAYSIPFPTLIVNEKSVE